MLTSIAQACKIKMPVKLTLVQVVPIKASVLAVRQGKKTQWLRKCV